MNPETDQWTFKTLKEYFERILVERDSLLDERDRRYAQMFSDSKEALAKADIALREYKQSANEFRGTLKDQAGTFITRTESENTAKELRNLINALQLKESIGEGGTKAAAAAKMSAQWIIGLIVGIALAALGFFLTSKAH